MKFNIVNPEEQEKRVLITSICKKNNKKALGTLFRAASVNVCTTKLEASCFVIQVEISGKGSLLSPNISIMYKSLLTL